MIGKSLVPKNGSIIKAEAYDEDFRRIIDPEAWAKGIILGEKYTEPNPNYLSVMLAVQSMTASSVEEVLSAAGVRRLQDELPNIPGAATEPFESVDLYVAPSDYDTGNSTYIILTVRELATGDIIKRSTGATSVQGQLIGLLNNGAWPFRGKFKRGDSKDKDGKYLLHLMPPD